MTGAPKARLVIVDDDEMLRSALSGNLVNAGYAVGEYADGASALAGLAGREGAIDLLILDWKMPGMTGLDVLRHLREKGVEIPILFFTSHNDPIYEEAALNFGAIDFVDKTRSFVILQKRIELILAKGRGPREAPEFREIGPLKLDRATHAAFWRGRRIALTLGEFCVVELLAQARRDFTYREIYDALRGDNFLAGEGPEGYRANVRALIKRIREKFGEADPGFKAIVNFPGFGYRWDDGEDGDAA